MNWSWHVVFITWNCQLPTIILTIFEIHKSQRPQKISTTIMITTQTTQSNVTGSSTPWHKSFFLRGGSAKTTIKTECISMPQNVLSTKTSTILVSNGTKTVLPPLSQLNLVSTLSNKMENLTISGRCLDRTFTRSFTKVNMGSLQSLVLTSTKLQSDSRGARLLLSHLPTSLQQLNLSWNGLGTEANNLAYHWKY